MEITLTVCVGPDYDRVVRLVHVDGRSEVPDVRDRRGKGCYLAPSTVRLWGQDVHDTRDQVYKNRPQTKVKIQPPPH